MSSRNKNIKKDTLARILVIYLFTMAFAVLLLFSMLKTITYDSEKWEKKREDYAFVTVTEQPVRGNIYDSKKKLLATSVPYYDICIDMKANGMTDEIFNKRVDSLAQSLSDFFGDKTKEEYLEYLKENRKKKNRGTIIAQNISFRDKNIVKQFPLLNLHPTRGGYVEISKYIRKRPFGNLCRRTIGEVKPKGENMTAGDFGIEQFYETQLRGRVGKYLKQKIGKKILMPVEGGEIIPAKQGLDIVTTFDINLQNYADSILRKTLYEENAKQGTIVMMEVETGYIKIMVNLGITSDSTYYDSYNYAVGQINAPGSTFKLPVLTTALEEGVKLTDTINTGSGYVKLYGVDIYDSHRIGKASVEKVFYESSNVGMSKIVNENFILKDKTEKYLDRLKVIGFGQTTGIDIKGEPMPKIKSYGDEEVKWSPSTPVMMSHGYEVETTPLQILNFYNAVANNGRMMKPQIVKEEQRNGQLVKVHKPQILIPAICSQKTLKDLKSSLEKVVTHGTARRIKNNKYSIAGKTGTAKYYDPEQGKYITEYRASFAGYFPANKPKYSCIVVIYKPKKHFYGGDCAAPVFKQIADKMYATDSEIHPRKKVNTGAFAFVEVPESKNGYKKDADIVFSSLQIQTETKDSLKSNWISTIRDKNIVKYKSNKIYANRMPKVTGMGAKDAMFLIEKLGLDVTLKGRGTVRKQKPKYGKHIKPGDKATLYLR